VDHQNHVEPSDEVTDLRSSGGPADRGAAGVLPTYLTRFVGRNDELHQMAALLIAHRLVTICGTGGLGKTRLAVEVARRCVERFPDGLLWVSLVGVHDGAAAERAIGAAALRHATSGVDPIASAATVIGGRRLLIVLDNCEHVAAACAAAALRLLDDCPSVRFVTTSRIPLQVPVEQVYAIPPLGAESQGLGSGDAVALFLDRAALGAPGWEAATAVGTIEQICDRLEGLPLAIELAASWVRVLAPTDLLVEITRGLGALSDVGEVVETRHRSMQAVLETTWTWLGVPERDALARLSVFVGGFGRDAAQDVAGATLGILATLSERALIRRAPVEDGETRYHVHELVRRFADERLREQRAWAETELRHFAYAAALVRSAQQGWDTEDEPAALARIAADSGNIEAAVTRAIERGAATDALRLAGGLFAYWIYTAPLEARRQLLERALALPADATEDPAIRARALNVAGYAWLYRDRRVAAERFSEAVTLYRRAGDRPGEAWTLRGLGYVHLVWDDSATSDRLNQESLLICREVGDRPGIAWSLFDGAESAVARRELDRALPLLIEAERAFADLGIDYARYRTLILLGDVHRLERDWVLAIERYREALDLQRRRRFTTRGAEIMEGLGALATEVGRVDLTARLHGSAATWRRALGSVRLGYNETDFDTTHAAAQRRLPSSEWLHLFAGAQGLTVEEAEIDTERIARDLTVWCSSPIGHLTPRELDVLRLVAQGLSNPEIATRLVVSPRTVHAHVRSIFDKLGVSTRTAAALRARELGLDTVRS
jgi:non-specific serine/threonine protein kinase